MESETFEQETALLDGYIELYNKRVQAMLWTCYGLGCAVFALCNEIGLFMNQETGPYEGLSIGAVTVAIPAAIGVGAVQTAFKIHHEANELENSLPSYDNTEQDKEL